MLTGEAASTERGIALVTAGVVATLALAHRTEQLEVIGEIGGALALLEVAAGERPTLVLVRPGAVSRSPLHLTTDARVPRGIAIHDERMLAYEIEDDQTCAAAAYVVYLRSMKRRRIGTAQGDPRDHCLVRMNWNDQRWPSAPAHPERSYHVDVSSEALRSLR